MKWNEYNAAVSASNESAQTDSHRRAAPETHETENKKPNRRRNNKITVYLSDAELARLNAMVDKTIMNREQFIRKMIEGKTITEAPPAPLLQTVRMMKDAQFNIRKISECALLYFSCSNYVKDYRGTCLTRHYVRADAVEAVVEMELRRLAEYLIADENRFAEILAHRSIKQVEREKKTVQSELRKSEMRIEIIPKLLKTLYEDKLSGKTSEDNYCVLSQEYSNEREQLQKKILKLRRKLTEMGEKENKREEFIRAIRKFMEMRTLTKQVLNELIDHIDVYETQGTGKNKTQRLVIYYKFVGYLDIDPTQCHPNYTADIREGVTIEYVSCEPSDSLKELFSEGYNADDDSFEGAETEQA